MNKKITLITGVSREMGLGFETAKQLIDRGFEVIVTARNLDKAKNLATMIGAKAKRLDITDENQINLVAAEIETEYGRLDVLVNNAGAYFDQGGQPLSAEMAFIKEAFDTNLFGAWRLAKAFVPLLQKSEGGRIVNVSSEAGSFSDQVFSLENHPSNVPVYSLTKLALNGLTVKLARELKETNIKVNAATPGFVATYPGTEQWGARPVSKGAESIIWAATLPEDGPSGGFFRDGERIDW